MGRKSMRGFLFEKRGWREGTVSRCSQAQKSDLACSIIFSVSAFVGLMLLFKELWTGHPLEESGLIPYFFRSPIFSSVQSQLTLFFFFTEI